MRLEINDLFNKLENRRQSLLGELKSYTPDELCSRPGPDRWSILMTLEHIVTGEKGIRMTESELRQNPVRQNLKPGEMFKVVIDVLDNDIPVDVPDPSMEPDGKTPMEDLLRMWKNERNAFSNILETVSSENVNEVMFSHPATGPLDAVRTLKLAIAHFDTHHRQIRRIGEELNASKKDVGSTGDK